jgi:hypothetical protein
MTYTKGDIFLHKYTHKLYIFDGEVWREIVPSSYLGDQLSNRPSTP